MAPKGEIAAEYANRAYDGRVYRMGSSRYIDQTTGNAALEAMLGIPVRTRVKASIALASVVLSAGPAAAYIGPGIASGALGAVLGVIGGVFLAIFAVLYYPIKRALRRRRSQVVPEDGGKGEPQQR